MEQVLTRQNLRSKRFLRDEMFRCTRRGGEDPTHSHWMFTRYVSSKLENGVELGIRDNHSVFRVIKPFTERLFRSTFYHRECITNVRGFPDYILGFEIRIFNGRRSVFVGRFYYRSDLNPFVPERMNVIRNWNLFYHLNQPLTISIKTEFFSIAHLNPNNVESSSSTPKPLKKTFKHDQCVICLDRKPNVLFVKCRHTCVCNECEEAHPSTQCPCCRTGISEKLLI